MTKAQLELLEILAAVVINLCFDSGMDFTADDIHTLPARVRAEAEADAVENAR